MIPVETWLQSFGFIRNPFETTEAGSEAYYATDFLHETFVKPEGFDEILGHPAHPKSSLVFAARGKGKTSARLMTAHFCRQGLFPENMSSKGDKIIRVLPVHHARFERLSGEAASQSALVDAHVIEILLRAVPALVEMLIRYPDIAEGIKKLPVLHRLELQFFLLVFRTYVPLSEFKTARDVIGREITNISEARTPIGFSLPTAHQQSVGLSTQEIEEHLRANAQASPIDLLKRFVALTRELGLGAVYVLVDGLDEIPETADNFAAAAALLIPLLANLNLMSNTPFLVFKIFIPAEMEPLLLEATRKVRRDRLARQRLELNKDALLEILHRRLAYCSDGVVSSMDAISSVEMRGQIEKEMTIYAEGNPRRLALLGQYMLEHRCQVIAPDERQETYLLNKDDLNWATHKVVEGAPQKNATDIVVSIPQATLTQQAAQTPSDDWFRHELPAPIALAYLIYLRESVTHIRIWKMYELIEASLAFSSQVLLALLYQKLNKNTPLQLKKSGLRLERTSMGQWRIVLEKLPGMLAGLGIRSSFARACQRLLTKNGDFIRAINDERNRSAHGGPQSEKECSALLERYARPLQQYLVELEFLRQSYLIRVLQVKKNNDKYLHRCTSYVGDAIIFPTMDIELTTPLDSDRLWLLDSDGPVILHPLMLVTSDDKIGEDVWLYQGFDKDEVFYKSYGRGQTMKQSINLFDISQIIGL